MKLKFLGTVFIFLLTSINVLAQKSKVDSLIAAVKTAKLDTNKALLLIDIIKEATNERKFDIANRYGKEALDVCEKLNYTRGINNATYYTAYNYYKRNDNENAIKYMSRALSLFEKAKNAMGIGMAAGNLGNTYYRMDLYPKALDYFLLAFKTFETLDKKYSMAGYAGNIGAIYNSMKQDDKALEFYQKSLKLNEEIKSEQGKAINYVCIANVYNQQKKYKEALEYHEKALAINEKIGSKEYISNNLANIGLVKINLKDYKGGLETLNLALEKVKDLKDTLSIASIERNIGDLYYKTKDYKESEKHLKEALVLAIKKNTIKLQKDVYFALYKVYAETEQFQLSLESYQKYIPLKDSLFGISNQKAILQKQMQYDFEAKEAITKAEFIKQQSLNLVEIEKRKQAITQLEKDNALKQLSLSESNLRLKEKEAESETQKRQVELLNKDKLIQEAETQKKAKELEQQKQLRNFFVLGAILLLCFAVYILFNLSKSKKTNKIIEKQKQEVEHQKHIVEEKQKEIVDSINYAQRIQYALLANKKLLDENLPDYFLFFQPKDVVSGDFYWASKVLGKNGSENFVMVTADSTGHGVPGAIMSILNIACLNESVKGDKLSEPAEILNATRQKVIDHMMHDGSAEGGKDGMDCSLICFDFKNSKLIYAAANNPIWIVRENELITYAADKMPVGRHDKDSVPFMQTEVELKKGDVVYAFTDGYADQFGGPKGKKYKYKQLQELLLSIHAKPMPRQHDLIRQSFMEWKGNLEQVDDVCVIGVRI